MTDTATRLLDAVDAVIADHGPSGVTLRRVGEAAGLSHTAGAHHFGDKPGLFTAYITRAWNRVADGVDAAATNADTRQALLDVARFYADFAIEHRGEFSVMSRLELANVDATELWAARERGFFALAGLVERLQADAIAPGRDPLDLLATLWGLVHGVTDLWVGGPLWAPYDGNELGDTVVRLVGALLDNLSSLD
ncbi:MAG: TetR/AcrR family transcriptional regulator [Ilumatobacter sp.]